MRFTPLLLACLTLASAGPGKKKDHSSKGKKTHPTQIEFRWVGGNCQDAVDSGSAEQVLGYPDRASCVESGCGGTSGSFDVTFDDLDASPVEFSGALQSDLDGFMIGSMSEKLPAEITVRTDDDAGCQQDILMHASCSIPVGVGMRFGPLEITRMTDAVGDILYCDKETTTYADDANNNVDNSNDNGDAKDPKPKKEKKEKGKKDKKNKTHPTLLQFKYVGGTCQDALDSGNALQVVDSPDRASCDDASCVGSGSGITVTIDDMDGSPFTGAGPDDLESIVVGFPTKKLPAELEVVVSDDSGCSQNIVLHTSCSVPIAVGMRFGPWKSRVWRT